MPLITDSVLHFYNSVVQEDTDTVDIAVLEFCEQRRYRNALKFLKDATVTLKKRHSLLNAIISFQLQGTLSPSRLLDITKQKKIEPSLQVESLAAITKLVLSSTQRTRMEPWMPAIESAINFLEDTIDAADTVQSARVTELVALCQFFSKAMEYYDRLPEAPNLKRLLVLRTMEVLGANGGVQTDLNSLRSQIDICLKELKSLDASPPL
jgi:hypothetical protein